MFRCVLTGCRKRKLLVISWPSSAPVRVWEERKGVDGRRWIQKQASRRLPLDRSCGGADWNSADAQATYPPLTWESSCIAATGQFGAILGRYGARTIELFVRPQQHRRRQERRFKVCAGWLERGNEPLQTQKVVVIRHGGIVVAGVREMACGECEHRAQQHRIAGRFQWHHRLEVVSAVVDVVLSAPPSRQPTPRIGDGTTAPTSFSRCVMKCCSRIASL